MNLTSDQREELSALQTMNDILEGPSFLHHSHHVFYEPMVKAGLVEWGPAPSPYDPEVYAGATITEAGRALLQREAA